MPARKGPMCGVSLLAVLGFAWSALPLLGADTRVAAEDAQRVETVSRISPSVVAVVTGGGSGVLISADGYALTNFHVVAGQGPALRCGLPDGNLYHAVLVGLDRIGDVALIKLLPRKPEQKFPFAVLGNSDLVKVGDWSLALGNPFMLATDFTPTVTFGMVSGVKRYQYPERGMFEYTDCIQSDTSINPGNSGGPLFNLKGELIGINGRGSFDKRGRVNSGVGYAISINQIKNFLGHLKAGLLVDHASLGAVVASSSEEEGARPRVLVSGLIPSDAERRGLQLGDELVRFGGRSVTTVNQFKNVLGLYPKGWRVPLAIRRERESGGADTRQMLVRLMGYERQEPEAPQPPKPVPGRPGQPMPPASPKPAADSPALKLFEAKAGYANWYFNKMARDRLLANLKVRSDFSAKTGDWVMRSKAYLGEKGREGSAVFRWAAGTGATPDRMMALIDGIDFTLEPLKTDLSAQSLRDPPGSGGLLSALYQVRQLFQKGGSGFVGDTSHGGMEPYYPPQEKDPEDWSVVRVDTEVLRVALGGVESKLFFQPGAEGYLLVGLEATLDRDEDPCEIHFGDYRPVDGKLLPFKIIVSHAGRPYCRLEVQSWDLK
ncbi:MAG: S1C family serine protease [Gemmataceae bacterium]